MTPDYDVGTQKSNRFTVSKLDLNPDTIKKFFEENYSRDERAKVKHICMDMNAVYQNFVHELFPNAEIVIDRFHIINDTCGYLSGNKLLNEFAAIILRSITSGGFGARIGGDNFAVLIKDEGDDALPIAIIDKIQTGLAGVMGDKLGNQPVSCSAGYCKMSDGGDDFAQVLDRAEFSLSLSGDTRGNVVRYDIKIHDKIIQSNIIEKELAFLFDKQRHLFCKDYRTGCLQRSD